MNSSKVLVLACKIKFNSTVNELALSNYNNNYFDVLENEVNVSNIDWFDKESFEEEIENLITFSQEIKNKIKGDVLVYVKGSDDSVETGRYHITSKGSKFSSCDVNITVRQEKKEKPKQLTEDEKIALFREYWDKKHSAPGKNEVYKGFRIGNFYTTAMKNEDLITALKGIMV